VSEGLPKFNNNMCRLSDNRFEPVKLSSLRKRITLAGLFILFSGLHLLSQSQPAQNDKEVRSSYILGAEDQIVIHAVDVPDISDKPMRLDLSGDIKIPMVGRIHAGGLTSEQLEAELTKRLAVYLEKPDVAVTIAEFHSQPVSVIGEVNTPGVQQIEGRKTLIEILSQAGGLNANAGPNITITRRIEWGRIPLSDSRDDPTGRFSIAAIELKPLINAKTPEKNIVIRPYDVISVPRAETVYVIGEVGKVGPLTLNERHTISVLQAISSSGGVLRTAAPAKAKILRPVAGSPTWAEFPVDIKKILKGQAKDQTLVAGDILFVPDSAGKRAGLRALESAIQAGTMVATYGVVR
jgi:polysaccharide export outer membrane protein